MPAPLNVIVTGSTSGIGLGIATSFAAAGARIVLNDLRANPAADAVVADFQAKYGKDAVIFVEADVSKPDQIQALVDKAISAFGHVDVMVQNAGIQHTADVVDFPAEKWEQIIAVNLSSVFYGAKAVLPSMLARGSGRIINIASTHGLVASKEKSAYVAAKHGVVGLTKVIALETAESKITCNAICPGWVLTPLVEKQIQARAAENGTTFDVAKVDVLREKQPSMDFVTPEQIGAMALYLASDAAIQITGQQMVIDGGWTAR